MGGRAPWRFGTGGLSEDVVFGDGTQPHCVEFDLLNLFGHVGQGITDSTGTWRGRVVLKDDLWVVQRDQLRGVAEAIGALKLTRGYGVAHVGLLRRLDERASAAGEVEPVLSVLFGC